MPEGPWIYSQEKQPIEHLAERIGRGEIDLAYGRALAAQPAITAALNIEYTQAVARLINQLATRGNARPALVVADLLRSAVEALPDQAETSAVRVPGELAWIRAVTCALPEQPDWRLYRSARAVGVRLLRLARSSGDQQLERWAHSELGELHFQPLLAPYSGDTGWPAIIQAWYERGNQTSGDAKPYPQPGTAFARALSHFRRAARDGPDTERALALKGQIQALDWLGRVRGESHLAEMAEIAAAALPLLDQRTDLAGITYLMGIRQQAGHSLDTDVFKRVLSVPLEEQIQWSGAHDTVTAHLNLAILLETDDPRLALALIERVAPALAQAQDANILARHCNALISTLVRTMFNGTVDNSAGTLPAAQEVWRRAEVERLVMRYQ